MSTIIYQTKLGRTNIKSNRKDNLSRSKPTERKGELWIW